MQWIRALRLTQAKSLREAGVPVSVISARVGYESPSALTAAIGRARQG
jgi:AraC-like DNA-binding protein